VGRLHLAAPRPGVRRPARRARGAGLGMAVTERVVLPPPTGSGGLE
jgi:hypothetical protein